VIQSQSVGYEITLPKIFFEKLVLNQTLSVWVHTHVREDILALYGFESEQAKATFRLLLSVSGLGPKTALALLSENSSEKIFESILYKDESILCETPGVGKKLAQKIILELSSKVEKMSFVSSLQKSKSADSATIETTVKGDLASALVHLGYSMPQVKPVIENLFLEAPEIEFDIALKQALKTLSNRPLI
jgi:Holliday junction DNA helicase RuvA